MSQSQSQSQPDPDQTHPMRELIDFHFSTKNNKVKNSLYGRFKLFKRVSISMGRQITIQEYANWSGQKVTLQGLKHHQKNEPKPDMMSQLKLRTQQSLSKTNLSADKSFGQSQRIRALTSKLNAITLERDQLAVKLSKTNLSVEVAFDQAKSIRTLTSGLNAITLERDELAVIVENLNVKNLLIQKQMREYKINDSLDNEQQEKKINQKMEQLTKQLGEKIRKGQGLSDRLKKIHNDLQQHKGNLRVYCRLRPCPLESQSIDFQVSSKNIKVRRGKNLKSNGYPSQLDYQFQKVFDQKTTQTSIFNQFSELVQSAVDGKNVCIFAYGQTGCGKTFTMNGSLEGQNFDELKGFAPRSIEYIFDQVKQRKSQRYNIKIFISVTEIYKGEQKDLLSKNSISTKPKGFGYNKVTTPANKHPKEFKFIQASDVNSAISLIKKTMKSRTTASTNMNPQSSRSHLIFEIRIETEHIEKRIVSSLVLIDLAGSEKFEDVGTSLERQQQSTSINNSLTALGNVLRTIKGGGKPIFRGNPLIEALQRHLEGKSIVVMFVNVSTENVNFEQTKNSLNFADQARGCKLSKESKRTQSLNK